MKPAFYFKPETVSRGKGKTVLTSVVYITGEPIRCSVTGIVYRRKTAQQVLVHGLRMPRALERLDLTRERLWNAVKHHEVRSNSVEARELIVGLPDGLSRELQESAAREIADYLVQRYDVPVEWALHAPDPRGDDRNFHLHLVFGTRRVEPDGSFGPKTRELDDLYGNDWSSIRQHVAAVFDWFMHEAGLAYDDPTRVAIDDSWQPTIHEGPAVTAMERRDIRTRRRAKNEEVKASNAEGAARSIECAYLRRELERLEALASGIYQEYLLEVMPPANWPQLTDQAIAAGLSRNATPDVEVPRDRPRLED